MSEVAYFVEILDNTYHGEKWVRYEDIFFNHTKEYVIQVAFSLKARGKQVRIIKEETTRTVVEQWS